MNHSPRHGPNDCSFLRGQKVILLEGREMGLSWEMNQAGMDLLKKGRIQEPWLACQRVHGSTTSSGSAGSMALRVCRNQHRPDQSRIENLSWRFASSRIGSAKPRESRWFPLAHSASVCRKCDCRRRVRKRFTHRLSELARIRPSNHAHERSYHGTVYSRADTAAAFLEASRKYWIPSARR